MPIPPFEALAIDTQRTRAIRVALATCLVFIGAILLVTLSAKALDATISPQVDGLVGFIRHMLHCGWFTRGMLEKGANILMFAPLGIALVLGLGRKRWLACIGIAAVLSAGVELAQLLFLHARTASVVDFALNTTGAATGVALAVAAIALYRRRRPSRSNG